MPETARHPLHRAQPERRKDLTRHCVEVIEPLIAAGATYADLSVEAIIRAGGISRGTFYAYFRDKGDLLQAMASDVGEEIAAAGTAWWEIGDGVTEDELRTRMRPSVDAYLRHKVLLRAVAEAAAYDANVRAAYGELMRDTIAKLTAHIASRPARGLDAERTATWLVWMLERGLYQAVSVSEDEVDAWLASAARIVWSTLYSASVG
ncbi:MAG: TetR/AcrR family transcriptional regulator, ethionamide resistance regulator [Solirubrobacteraceae bacterium]|nr:TetR/AcrR family transcriptional regulator, ethionamide resistance regulator [Solirubrobacteraceae bacterium]